MLSMRFLLCVVGGFALAGLYHSQASATPAQDCKKPVYLTFDTGHMAVAPVIADILARQKVVVTFFAANEKTKEGDGSLGEHWGAGGVSGRKKGMNLLLTLLTMFTGLRMPVRMHFG